MSMKFGKASNRRLTLATVPRESARPTASSTTAARWCRST